MARTTPPAGDPATTGSATTDRAALAGDVIRRISHLAGVMQHQLQLDLVRLALTPAVARALLELDPDRPLPARDLADQLACDRSNITALVDKLEQAGLVRRRADPADRRLKTLVVTDEGRRVRAEVQRLSSDSRLLDGLGDEELATLRELVWKVSDGGCPEECPPG